MKMISFEVTNSDFNMIELAARNDTEGMLAADEYAKQCLLDEVVGQPRCRKCGCSQSNCAQCIEKTGEPCHWVEEDLCSACVPAKLAKPRRKKKARTK